MIHRLLCLSFCHCVFGAHVRSFLEGTVHDDPSCRFAADKICRCRTGQLVT